MRIIQIFVLIFAISSCQSNPLLSNFPGNKTSADVTLSPLDYESEMQKGAAAYKSENFSLALSYFKPLSKAGLGDAQAMLGYMYLDGQGVPQNTSEALLWLEKAANQGVSEASTMLGHAYLDGDKGFKQSDQDGAYWFFRAALLGQPQAQFQLGRLYSKGTGVEENVQEAYKWYNKSANAGYAPAQHNVAVYLMEGKGVSKNTTEGADWFRRAATQNYKRSQRSLAGVYFLGDGVEQNLSYAYMWGLIYAQDDLEGESQAMLDYFAKHMSKKEIEDAYKKAVFCLQNTLAECELNNAKFL